MAQKPRFGWRFIRASSVIDNGPGLADVDIPLLFERFYQIR
ncbi:MAG: ATP-binding protein [Microthrixaceae bacterium]